MKNALELQETRRIKGLLSSELDVVLSQPELDTLRKRFWAWYHLTFGPDEDVPDAAVSQAFKEITKRAFSVRDLWKVRGLATFQKLSSAPFIYYAY